MKIVLGLALAFILRKQNFKPTVFSNINSSGSPRSILPRFFPWLLCYVIQTSLCNLPPIP